MTRDWRLLQIMIRADVIERLRRKYPRMKIEEIIEEVAYQEVCVRAMNHCSQCGKEIFVWILKIKHHEVPKWEAVRDAVCNKCQHGSQWRRYP